MNRSSRFIASLALVVMVPTVSNAAGDTSRLGALSVAVSYQPDKVVYDVVVDAPERFHRLLDRVSYLNDLYADPFVASIVLVLHGPEVAFFANKDTAKYQALVERAQSLAYSEIVKFRMCAVAAKARGLEAKDLPDFIQLVPMGDAEVVRLQRDGYVFMR